MLSDEQIERYSRQIILPQVGGKGQEKLLRARVLVQAHGPLHAAAVHYLAAAGVGTLGVFADTQDALLAALAASQQSTTSFHVLSCLNPDCAIALHSAEGTKSPHQLVQSYDCVLSDSPALHDVCYAVRRPFLYASLSDEEASLMVCRGYELDAPCLRCVMTPELRPLRASPLAEIAALFIGTHLATEAIKLLIGYPSPPETKVLRFHLPTFTCSAETVRKSSHCTICTPL